MASWLLRDGRRHVSPNLSVCIPHSCVCTSCGSFIDIIGMLFTGVLLLTLFLLWQHCLERSLTTHPPFFAAHPNLHPPPLMKLSIWSRAHGRFAVVQAIALLEWMCFLGWNFWLQLYYQYFQHLTPILAMTRMLPMFITGVICNVIIAAVVGRVPMVLLIGRIDVILLD